MKMVDSKTFKKKDPFLPICLFAILWLLWAVCEQFGGQWLASPLAELLGKTLCWGLPPLIVMLHGGKNSERWIVPVKKLFSASFPVLPCVVALCLTTAFLYTVRILNGLVSSFPFFDWYFIAASVCAGVVEEFFFRAYLFGRMAPGLGFWPAALMNGALFTLYHYPELLFGGSFLRLLSLRALLIFVMGVIFCGMFKKWRCIAMNMVVHTVWDILSFLFCLG